jgi:hypothetical protein
LPESVKVSSETMKTILRKARNVQGAQPCTYILNIYQCERARVLFPWKVFRDNKTLSFHSLLNSEKIILREKFRENQRTLLFIVENFLWISFRIQR